MYSAVIHHLYTALCVHHPKSSLLPSPFLPSLPFSTSPSPFPSSNHHTVVCVYEFVCIFLVWFVHLLLLALYPRYEWNHMVLEFFIWLILLSMISSRSIHIGTNDIISSFLMAEWYSIVYMYHMFFGFGFRQSGSRIHALNYNTIQLIFHKGSL